MNPAHGGGAIDGARRKLASDERRERCCECGSIYEYRAAAEGLDAIRGWGEKVMVRTAGEESHEPNPDAVVLDRKRLRWQRSSPDDRLVDGSADRIHFRDGVSYNTAGITVPSCGGGGAPRRTGPRMYTTAPSLLLQMQQPCNPAAWRRFVDLYSPLLFRWMRGVGLPLDDTADLAQEVFLAVFAHLPAFERRRAGSFRTWLRTIVVNKVRTFQRRKKTVPLGPDAAPSVPPELIAAWEAEYASVVLGRALELVEPEFEPLTWQAFRKLQLEGTPAAEVAAELGVTRNAVYIARCRVLRRLRDEVEHLLD